MPIHHAMRSVNRVRPHVKRFFSNGNAQPITREEMKAEFNAIRTEFNAEMNAMKTDVAVLSAEVKAEISSLNKKIDLYDQHMRDHVSTFKWSVGAFSAVTGAALGIFGYKILDNSQSIGRLQGQGKTAPALGKK